MRIILEGPKQAGKSTLITFLKNNYYDSYDVVSYKESIGSNNELDDSDFDRLNKKENGIYDSFYIRWLVEDYVTYKPNIKNTINTLKQIEERVDKEQTVLIVFNPSLEFLNKNILKNDQVLPNLEEQKMIYNKLYKASSLRKVLYDPENDSINKILNLINQKPVKVPKVKKEKKKSENKSISISFSKDEFDWINKNLNGSSIKDFLKKIILERKNL